MLPSKAPRALQPMCRPSIRQTTMAAATARPARKPRAQSRRRSWAIILASEAIERVYKAGSELVLFLLVEKRYLGVSVHAGRATSKSCRQEERRREGIRWQKQHPPMFPEQSSRNYFRQSAIGADGVTMTKR